jgi:colanic acid/amylovoran biosynthesis glycosyltransferase
MAIGRENLALVIGAKLAVSFRGFDHYVFPLKHPDCYTLLFKLVDKVHVLSQGMRKSISTKGIPNGKIYVITPAFDMRKRIATISRADNKKINLITVARLHWIKGLEYTLESLALLMQSGADFHYTIIGEGEERERLMFAVYQLGLTDRVTFCGRLSHDETIQKLAQADIYIQYSIQEGFCNAVLEAQAMGLLCVVSDAEGLSENVWPDKTGWVVPKRNPTALAAKIKAILKLTSEERERISKAAAERVSTHFSLEQQRSSFMTFYNSNE